MKHRTLPAVSPDLNPVATLNEPEVAGWIGRPSNLRNTGAVQMVCATKYSNAGPNIFRQVDSSQVLDASRASGMIKANRKQLSTIWTRRSRSTDFMSHRLNEA